MVRIHNTETDEVIDRLMTDDEFSQWQIDQEATAKRLEAEEKAIAKKGLVEAKLALLGITPDDLRAIGL